ncbi:MAG TPA: hypothetical protein VJ739_03880 [Gemmataceae bacterium]|nr:hypothetical protein [Gemmataceae bacterium]
MTSETKAPEELIRLVVRGERPWTELRSLGIELRPEEGYAAEVPPLDLQVNVGDLAQGFRAHLQNPRALKEWAFVMEALPTDFEAEQHPSGEAVMNALWSASFGEPLSAEQIDLLKNLAGEGPKQP